jgi:hypothetical protein
MTVEVSRCAISWVVEVLACTTTVTEEASGIVADGTADAADDDSAVQCVRATAEVSADEGKA